MPAMYSYSYGDILLKIDNVCLEYDGRPVLKDVSAEIRNINRAGNVQGQVVGILGPSGIGKTQLFRIIAGLNQPTSGRVTLNGFDRPVHAGEVGVVAQNYPLFEHRTVLSNLVLAASQKVVNGKHPSLSEVREKVNAMLELFELTDKKHLYPAQLSGGQRQRAAIIQQILCSEHFLLMDEPFSGLDIVMEETTLQLILQVANMDDLNTVIVVTHDVSAAASICDHIWLLGRDFDAEGNKLPGSHIVESYDLIERGLCWEKWSGDAMTRPSVAEFIREVKDRFRTL